MSIEANVENESAEQSEQKKFWETIRPIKKEDGFEGGKSGNEFPWSHYEFNDGTSFDYRRFNRSIEVPVSSVRELLSKERFDELYQKFPNLPQKDNDKITIQNNNLNFRIGDKNFTTNGKGVFVYGEYSGIASAIYSDVLKTYDKARLLEVEEKKEN